MTAEFTRLYENKNGAVITFTDYGLTTLYARIRDAINAGRSISTGDRNALFALARPTCDDGIWVRLQTQATRACHKAPRCVIRRPRTIKVIAIRKDCTCAAGQFRSSVSPR